MPTDTIALHRFAPEHLGAAHALTRDLGWPHRAEDWAAVLSLSRGRVALEAGRVVGTILLTPFGPACTINSVIVAAHLRGRGLGRRLMHWAIDAAGDARCRLVATPDGVPLYHKLGFRAEGEIAQHQGLVTACPGHEGVAWATAADLPAIARLDREATCMDRAALLDHLARAGRFAVTRTGPFAYAALRPFGHGEVAGPVVAADPAQARQLLGFLLARRQGGFLRVDTPRGPDLSAFLAASGLACVDTGVAMSRPPAAPPRSPRARVHALASQALG